MALIRCSECGKEFSDKASACPNCACPTNDIKEDSVVIFNQQEKIECCNCGKKFDNKDGNCPYCGCLNACNENNNGLIKCRSCGKEISNKAITCIYCGCPIENENMVEESEMIGIDFSKNFKELTDGERRKFVIGCLTEKQYWRVFILSMLCLFSALSSFFITLFLILIFFNFSVLLLDILFMIISVLLYLVLLKQEKDLYNEYVKNLKNDY